MACPSDAAPLLGVNIDHVATLRNARGGSFPDPVLAAQQAVDLIPRTAAAFAQESDVELARATLAASR